MGDTADTPDATMVITSVAQLVINRNVNYLAELISDYHSEGRKDLLEVDDDTYINPLLILTMGKVTQEEPSPAIVPASALPPGMAQTRQG